MSEVSTLYHYCSTTAFLSIVSNRTIRLSSLALSNDSKEGKLVRETLLRLSAEDNLNMKFTQRFEKALLFLEEKFDGLGFCLSERRDLLSQWRGYADNGNGVALGFSKTYLESLGNVLKNRNLWGFDVFAVRYTAEEHRNVLIPAYVQIRELISQGAFELPGLSSLLDTRTEEQILAKDQAIRMANQKLFAELMRLYSKLFELKAHGFQEEKEWRVVSTGFVGHEDFESTEFRAARDRVIPFRTVELFELHEPPLEEVVIGPRHASPPEVLTAMLKRYGFGEVPVRMSEVSYR